MKIFVVRAVALAIVCLASGLGADPAKGALIVNVDFGIGSSPVYSGAGAASFGASGQTWNGVSSDSVSGLLDSTGSATGVAVSMFGGGNYSNQPMSANLAGADALMQDYRFTFGQRRIDITGLNAGDQYDIYIYSAGNLNTPNQGSQFFIPAVTGGTTYSPMLGVAGTPSNPETTANGASSLVLGVNYQRFTGVIGSSGLLSFEQGRRIGQTTGGQVINGFQLQTISAVPEPSSFAALTIVGLAAAGYRRRRRLKSANVVSSQ